MESKSESKPYEPSILLTDKIVAALDPTPLNSLEQDVIHMDVFSAIKTQDDLIFLAKTQHFLLWCLLCKWSRDNDKLKTLGLLFTHPQKFLEFLKTYFEACIADRTFTRYDGVISQLFKLTQTSQLLFDTQEKLMELGATVFSVLGALIYTNPIHYANLLWPNQEDLLLLRNKYEQQTSLTYVLPNDFWNTCRTATNNSFSIVTEQLNKVIGIRVIIDLIIGYYATYKSNQEFISKLEANYTPGIVSSSARPTNPSASTSGSSSPKTEPQKKSSAVSSSSSLPSTGQSNASSSTASASLTASTSAIITHSSSSSSSRGFPPPSNQPIRRRVQDLITSFNTTNLDQIKPTPQNKR